ncbi:hypothetical protein [Nocardioides xinjiangensis]|uniref:hypothetical protein n=1 Tax=Nocardioides xinjiangensis TaxID=2817376 RepID=UPI001B300D4A|nr:hypothetical protein [Nocardioides sp. SYSU D00514]
MLAGPGSGVDGAAGTDHGFTLYSDGEARWHIRVMSDAEDGTTNVGSSLAIAPVRDDGTVDDHLPTIYRNGDTRVGMIGGEVGFFGGTPPPSQQPRPPRLAPRPATPTPPRSATCSTT